MNKEANNQRKSSNARSATGKGYKLSEKRDGQSSFSKSRKPPSAPKNLKK